MTERNNDKAAHLKKKQSRQFIAFRTLPSAFRLQPMDANEFRKRGREMVDYIADYMENIHERRVLPEVQPGYLRELLPNKAPNRGENWTDIWKDVENAIMIGVA